MKAYYLQKGDQYYNGFMGPHCFSPYSALAHLFRNKEDAEKVKNRMEKGPEGYQLNLIETEVTHK